jgi:hypothetical protein
LYRKPEQRKSLFPALCRERGIKQLYARFSAGGLHLTLDSSTCCLKNSIIILPQTRGVVKRFFEFSDKIFLPSANRQQKNIRNSD